MAVTVPTTKDLFQAGVHFGHQTNKWHPKMSKYIYTQSLGVHVIDLVQTEEALKNVYKYLYDETSKGAQVLFVGNKKQASEIIRIEAGRSGASYVSNRWIGGMLTNVSTIRSNIKKLTNLRAKLNSSESNVYTKKEKNMIQKEIEKLESIYGGIETLTNPEILVVIDPKKENTAVKEAKILGMKVVALADTNTNPEGIDYLIPGNDDAIRSIDIVVSTLARAVQEGYTVFKENKSKKTKVSIDNLVSENSEAKKETKEKTE